MLQLKGIYKTFNAGTVNEKRAIDNLNLTLEDGDFVTIIGGNGARQVHYAEPDRRRVSGGCGHDSSERLRPDQSARA